MKKLYSLIKACMTSDMNLFKIKSKNKNSKILIPLLISLYLIFIIYNTADKLFSKLAPMHLQYLILSLAVFSVSLMTIIEGIYKTGPLIFNSKDDQLLLSLPIKRRTVLFIRIFKFYVFELFFNSLFLLPFMLAYIKWADSIHWTYYLTSFIMLFILPIIPIIISTIIGALLSSISSRFKHKNMIQIVLSMAFLVLVLYFSYSLENIMEYVTQNANSINDLITKIYYPSGIYARLVTNFSFIDLLVFILINIVLFITCLLILSKVYFKINSRLKKVIHSKRVNINDLKIKSKSVYKSLIQKELNTFFNTPVFIINAGFGLLLFILSTIIVSIKFDSLIPILTNEDGMNLAKDLIMNNLSMVIFLLIIFTSFMTSITNSVISLEGRNINILKSLPLKTKTILMSKIYSSLLLTTPVLLIGDFILFIKFNISFIDSVLIIILSVLLPLVSHFIGLIINLKYPKLDAENSAEVVKQSTSSFISLMLGMLLLIINISIVINLIGKINSTIILVLSSLIYIIIDLLLYLYLTNKSVKDFNNLLV